MQIRSLGAGACLALTLLVLSPLASSASPLVLRAERMLDVETGEIVSPAVLVIDGEEIVGVGAPPPDGDVETLDLGDVTLLPGLIDLHTHLTYDLEGDWPNRPVKVTAADRALLGVPYARRTLLAGFTTVRDVWSGWGFADVALMRAIDAGLLDGPRIVPSGNALSITGGHCEFTGFAPGILEGTPKDGVADGVDEVTKAVRYQIKHGAKVIKICATAGVLSFEGPVGAQQYSEEEMRAIVEEADRHGVRVAAHAHGTEGIVAATRAGVASIEHGSILSDDAIALMKERGTFLVPNLYLVDAIDPATLPPQTREKWESLDDAVEESFRMAMDAGLKIGFGTDSGVYPHGENAREFDSRVRRGMAPIEAIRGATLYAAELLGVDDRGVLAPGRLADVVAVPGNPLENVRTLEDVRFVMKGGVIVKGPGSDRERARAFDERADDVTRVFFEHLPEIATYYGAPEDLASGASARLADRSPDGERRRRAALEGALADLRSFDADGLDDARRIARDSMINVLDGALEPARVVDYGSAFGEYGVWFLPYPVVQNSGPLVALPTLLEAQHGIADRGDADAYLARLAAYADALDGALAKVRHDAALGVVPPDFVLEKALGVLGGFAAPPPRENLLVASFAAKLETAGIAATELLVARAAALVGDRVLPAGRRLEVELRARLAEAPHDAGIWRLPDGPALYRAMVRHMTDADRSPEEIHGLGLREVDRILAEMDAILRAEGRDDGTVGERFARLREEERFLQPDSAAGRAAILEDIEGQLAAVSAELPRWIGTIPEVGVEVRAVPVFSQDSAPGGYYDPPALDGSRPGIYWINLRDTSAWPSFMVPTLSFHEAVPGHHLQVASSLGQDQPLLLTVLFSNPSGEGWALYAEKLAAEMGLYEGDPFGDLGRLQAELHRAVRLVVDTGMHAMKWSRERAIEYMMETEGAQEAEAVSEIERYAVWPAQALGYKIGMLELEALRAEAEATLGEDFDVRRFHDRVLEVSSAPLPIIAREIRAWIDAGGP